MPAPIRILSLVVKLDSGLGAGVGVGAMVLVGAGEASVGFVSRGVVVVMGVGKGDAVEDGSCLTAIGAAKAWVASFVIPLR